MRSTVMYWDNVMISSWQMDTTKQVYTRHIFANSTLNLRDVMYNCDLYIQIMLCSMETHWNTTVYFIKVVALHVHVFSFKILYQQPRYGQNMSQYGISISMYRKGRLLCSHNLLYLKYILMLSCK